MPRPTIEDYKLRLMILNEWKRKSKEVAEIINKRLDKNVITSTDVQKYFKSFNEDDIFEDDSQLSVQKKGKKDIDSLLLMTNDDKHFEEGIMTANDGRFIMSFYEDSSTSNYFIQIYDLFLNLKKYDYKFDYKFIGKYLLAIDENYLNLFKVNYDDLTVNLLDSTRIDDEIYYIFPDQFNDYKFILYIDEYTFAKGHIREDKLVLDEPKHHSEIHYERLMDNKFQGFVCDDDDRSLVKFCEIDLDTMERKEIDAPFVLNDESISFTGFRPHHWSKNRFYGMFWMKNSPRQLLMFDLETLKWSNTGISANKPWNLFIDSNEILTLQVGDFNCYAFYRIHLRKPDTLLNLSWLTASRQSTLCENHKYLEHAKRFSIKL